MFTPILIPTSEELSKLNIEGFDGLLKTNYENAEMHYVVFYMLLEVSVVYGLLDHQKYMQNYALEKKLELDGDYLTSLFKKAVECKRIGSIECLLELIDDEAKQKILKDISFMLFEKVEKTGSKEVCKLFKQLVLEKEDIEKITHAHMDSTVIKDENGKIFKPLKVLSMLDPSYQRWLSYSSDQGVKKVLEPYLDIVNLDSLKVISFAMGNLFRKGMGKILSKSEWKPIFTSDNEIILNIVEFFTGESGKYLQAVMPSIHEALGINEDFIDLYDARVEGLEVSGDDSGLESAD